MKFEDYWSVLKELHLYISKATAERDKIRDTILPFLNETDEKVQYHKEYSKENYLEKTVLFLQHLAQMLDLNELTTAYGIIDHLLITPHVLSLDIQQYARGVVAALSSYLPKFPILHELAVLCWYDEWISVDEFLQIMKNHTLSEKENYHILGELSHRYPRETIEFVVSEQIFGPHYLQRFKKKMQTIREKGSKKDFAIVGNSEEIALLWTRYRDKV